MISRRASPVMPAAPAARLRHILIPAEAEATAAHDAAPPSLARLAAPFARPGGTAGRRP